MTITAKKLLLFLILASAAYGQVGMIRGTAMAYGYAGGVASNVFTLSFPVGTASGDFALVFFGTYSSGTTTGPSGWTQLTVFGRNSYDGYVYYKTLTSGDVSTGSVTATQNPDSGTTVALVVMIGNPGSIRAYDASAAGGSPASIGLAAQVNDLAIYFASTETAATTLSFNTGTQLQNTSLLPCQGTGCTPYPGYPAGALYASPIAVATSYTYTASWSGGGTNTGVVGLLIENAGSAPSTGATANPSVFGIAVQ